MLDSFSCFNIEHRVFTTLFSGANSTSFSYYYVPQKVNITSTPLVYAERKNGHPAVTKIGANTKTQHMGVLVFANFPIIPINKVT